MIHVDDLQTNKRKINGNARNELNCLELKQVRQHGRISRYQTRNQSIMNIVSATRVRYVTNDNELAQYLNLDPAGTSRQERQTTNRTFNRCLSSLCVLTRASLVNEGCDSYLLLVLSYS